MTKYVFLFYCSSLLYTGQFAMSVVIVFVVLSICFYIYNVPITVRVHA